MVLTGCWCWLRRQVTASSFWPRRFLCSVLGTSLLDRSVLVEHGGRSRTSWTWTRSRNYGGTVAKCRSIGSAFTARYVEIVGGVPGFGRRASGGRIAGGMSVGVISIRGKMEGGDGVPSLGSSQTHGGRHGGSRLPLMGGVQVCCDA